MEATADLTMKRANQAVLLLIALGAACAPTGPASAPPATEPVRPVPTIAAVDVQRSAPPQAAPPAGPSSEPAPPAPTAATSGVGSGGGFGISCMGLIGDASPPPCPNATFCHRLSLADLKLTVASASSSAPPKEEIVSRFRTETRWQLLGPDGGTLTACFRNEPQDRPLHASVQIELTSKWGQCPNKPSRIVKTTATRATAECIRDSLDRVMLPGEETQGRARLVLEVSLTSLEPDAADKK